ncbi:MAG: Gldg family protein [Anaerolineales bacterium]|nr:Gldg family protein [Anaerolineales bacterium]
MTPTAPSTDILRPTATGTIAAAPSATPNAAEAIGTSTIYFLTGHGEHAIDSTDQDGLSTVVGLLERQNYSVQPLDLAVTATVPADARAVVVAGPLVLVTQDEVDRLKTYVGGGGALIVMLDPLIQTQTEVDAAEPLVEYLAQEWGVRLANDVVVDFLNSAQGQPLFPLNAGYGISVITGQLQGVNTVFPVVRSVLMPGHGVGLPSLTYTALIPAHVEAWGETNFESLNTQPARDDADTPPPLNLAVSVENSVTGARLVVIGDSDFASNAFADQGANANLLVACITWATTGN